MAGERRRRGGDGPRERPRERLRDRDPKLRQQQKPQRGSGRGRTALALTAAAAALALCLAAAAAGWKRWSEASRLVTPHPAPPAVPPGSTGPLASPTYFWGTYRPHVYFGMKTRSPRAVVTGLMWLQHGGNLRHTSEQNDGVSRYGWLMHDGENFGVQEIRDEGLLLRTEFVKQPGGDHGGDWSWRVTAKMEGKGPAPLLSLFFYVATDGQGTLRPVLENGTRLAAVAGMAEELGDFTLTFLLPTGEGGEGPKYASYNFLAAGVPGLHRLTDLVRHSLRESSVFSPPGRPRRRFFGVSSTGGLPGEPPRGQLLLHQVTLEPPAVLEVTLESGSAAGARQGRLAGPALSAALARHAAAFERRFEDTFGLGTRGVSLPQRRFAQAALSEMLGGIGFFHGRSLLRSEHREEPLPGMESVLFTAVPSRSCFPRGFLWDEGFHLLLLARWDPALARDILAHWLDLLNADGWIPREQILGEEARSRVPPEFVLQHSETANPPTLLLALERLLPDAPLPYLRRLFPRLRSWFEWLNRTQAGPEPFTFRWRGRDPDPERFLNPKTLSSGLDDYPRASHPSAQERHLDLRCWMALGARVLAALAERLGEPHAPYRDMAAALSDNALLERLHWAPELGAFADFGNHSSAVALRWHRPAPVPGRPPAAPQLRREVREAPRLQFVAALGYVSLFPLLLQLLRADSPRLPALLGSMSSEQQLWTPFGLRSLARDSPLYLRRNTEHDPPYWRGSVWVNINFLALRALHGYARAEGPHRERAAKLYRELRQNLVANVFRQYEATGFLWEHYRDSDGTGQGCHPFAGWSALVVLAMAEDY
ncbi:mannosyl-oligosaccharide glucosidase [Ammospiza nelsoni]|uniref:mannosyl-oligosaccharide glucosidase n=1 Tax=Ammospiza nelsoni TaxID=2857394 RepID=UPI00286B92E7|nr:mannosyl-oligosaccharide glucosidase [Ammospiza nelsoni]